MSDTRLPWQPHPEGGFIAFPEGWREQPERYARIMLSNSGGYGVFTWSVRYDGQAISDVVDDKQRASDAANAAWAATYENIDVGDGPHQAEAGPAEHHLGWPAADRGCLERRVRASAP